MLYVAKEFQTGLKVSEAAIRTIENLVKLQSRLNRPIHPIVFGGSKYKSGSYSEVHSPTAKGETIDKLLKANIEMRLKHLG